MAGHGLVFYPTGWESTQLLAIRPDGSGDVTATHVVWQFTRGVPKKPSLLLVDDLIFMVNDTGIATCVEAKTGTQVWQSRVGGTFSASPLYAAGRVYLFDEDGKTTVLEAGREFKVLAENLLDNGFMASPAVIGDALILRGLTRSRGSKLRSSPVRQLHCREPAGKNAGRMYRARTLPCRVHRSTRLEIPPPRSRAILARSAKAR